MKFTDRQLRILIHETLEEACWDGYRPGAQSGKKTKKGKTGKRVPNCEKINEDDEEPLEEAGCGNTVPDAPVVKTGLAAIEADDVGDGDVEALEEGTKMKITKRQIRRIIKEEKTKVLNEVEQHVVLSAWDQAIGNVEAVEKELYGLTDPGAPPGELPFGDELGKQLAAAVVELNQAYAALELHFDDESGRNPGGSIG